MPYDGNWLRLRDDWPAGGCKKPGAQAEWEGVSQSQTLATISTKKVRVIKLDRNSEIAIKTMFMNNARNLLVITHSITDYEPPEINVDFAKLIKLCHICARTADLLHWVPYSHYYCSSNLVGTRLE